MIREKKAITAMIAFVVGVVALAPVVFDQKGSNLTIDADGTFLLGGGQSGAFAVRGTNTGTASVLLSARPAASALGEDRGEGEGEADRALLTIGPGADFDQRFALGETALLHNNSATRDAELDVRVRGYSFPPATRNRPPAN